MNARRLILATVVSLSSLASGALFAAPTALAEESCPNAASRQGPSNALPDCRVYEQVTPVDKGDSSDLFGSTNQEVNTKVAPSEDGNHFLLISEAAFPVGGDAYFSGYVFSRGAEDWTTTSLSPGAGVYGQEPSIFDPENLSEVGMRNVLRKSGGLFGASETSYDIGPPGGPYTTLPGGGEGEAETVPVGASADLSHIVLESKDRELAPGDMGQEEGNTALYELVGGHLQLVNVATNGSLISPCGATLGEAGRENGYDVTNSAVSRDGSKVIFTSPNPEVFQSYGGSTPSGPGCWKGWNGNLTQEENEKTQENAPQLYMRIGGAKTVEISTPNANVHPTGPAQPAVFVGASADGSKVFFVSRAELTADDTGHANELYEYNTEAPEGERLVRVSSGESGSAEGKVDFVGAVSSDGSAVYFNASSKLAEGAPAEGGLYWYDTITRKTTYIASGAFYPFYKGVAQFFASGWYGSYLGGGTISSGGAGENPVPEQVALMRNALWSTTANGEYLLFPMPFEGHEELFRYSAVDSSLVCVSCANGVLAEPHLNEQGSSGAGGAANFGVGFEAASAPPTRPISEDGSYVFFQTYTALVPNTTGQNQHVYEWHDGKVSLISSPGDPSNAYFLGTSADGKDVFIGTHAQLGPQDTDLSGDIFDARIDGGFVGLAPTVCTGTGCQGVPAAPPIFATPASVTFEGVGNFPPGLQASEKPAAKTRSKPKRCKRGFVKRHGKCLRKKRGKAKKARKSARGRK